MADAYPVHLRVAGRPCLVVGGGAVGSRKARHLLGAGAAVVVVAPEATPEVAGWAATGALEWRRRAFRAADLDGMLLACFATADPAVQQAGAAAARARRVLCNVADGPADGDFHVPAVYRAGPVCVSAGTGGGSPGLAAWVRDRCAAALPPWLEEAAAVLGEVRQMTHLGCELSPAAVARVLASDAVEALAKGDRAAARRRVVELLTQGSSAGATPSGDTP